MKTVIFKTLAFCVLLLPLLAACSHDSQPMAIDDMDESNDNGDRPVDIIVSRNVSTGAGANGETDTKFTPGCLIGLTVPGSATYTNAKYQYVESGKALTMVENGIYWDTGVSSIAVNAYYPYREDGDYAKAYVVEDQNGGTGGENYYNSDALVATGSVSSRGASMNLSAFSHRMAKVIFTFSDDVSDVTILNQSLNTSAATGSASIKAYGETARKWKACIIPGQKYLSVTCVKNGKTFRTVFMVANPMTAGNQYSFTVDNWDEIEKQHMDLSLASVTISDDGTYYITQSNATIATSNSIIVSGGKPTIYIHGLNVSAAVAFNITGGSPIIRVVGSNTLKSTGFGASGIHLVEIVDNGKIYGSVKIAGSGTLTVIGGEQGCGIGTITSTSGDCNIDIEDCTVIATAGGTAPAGIGCREGAKCGNITIKNAIVTSTGTQYGAGIGSGRYGQCRDIEITLKSTDTKEEFLKRLSGYVKVGAGEGNGSTCGTITWKNADGSIIN